MTTANAQPATARTATHPGARLGLTYTMGNIGPSHPMRGPLMIMKGFVRAGWQVEVVTARNDQNAAMNSFWDTVPLRKVGDGSLQNGRRALRREMQRKRPNNINFTWIWENVRYGLLAGKLLHRNPYALVLDSYTHNAPWNKESSYDKLKQGLRFGTVLRNANLVLAESPFIRDYTRRQFPHVEALYVPVCMWLSDLQAIEQGWQQEAFAPPRRPVILYAGSIYPGKGIHDLLDAFAELAPTFPEWSVELVGPVTDVGYTRELREIIERSGLDQRVQFCPMLSGVELYRRYRSSEIFCLPSYREGVPMVVLEAMYFGGAVVTANVGFTAHQLDEGRCGLLYPPRDVGALREQLAQMMASEDLRRQLMDRARARVVSEFVWERYFDTVEDACRRHILGI